MTSNSTVSRIFSSGWEGLRRIAKRWCLSLLALLVLAAFFVGWWQSSRYSERHLVYVGAWTVEVFSSSSLLRISLVRGHVRQFGTATNYRQPNARGKFTVRPPVPRFASRPDMWEVTLGYWHLVSLGFVGMVAASLAEARKRREPHRVHGRP